MRTNHNRGYSLLDALTTIIVMSLLAGVAAPALSALLDRQRLQSLNAGLFHMANKARYLAMTSQNRVTLCPLSAQGQCQTAWSGSISSFIDPNGNRRLDPGEEILNKLYVPNNIKLHWRGMQPNNSIHFSSQGVTFVSNGTMSLCPSRPGTKGAITISRQGRVKAASEDASCPE